MNFLSQIEFPSRQSIFDFQLRNICETIYFHCPMYQYTQHKLLLLAFFYHKKSVHKVYCRYILFFQGNRNYTTCNHYYCFLMKKAMVMISRYIITISLKKQDIPTVNFMD